MRIFLGCISIKGGARTYTGHGGSVGGGGAWPLRLVSGLPHALHTTSELAGVLPACLHVASELTFLQGKLLCTLIQPDLLTARCRSAGCAARISARPRPFCSPPLWCPRPTDELSRACTFSSSKAQGKKERGRRHGKGKRVVVGGPSVSVVLLPS